MSNRVEIPVNPVELVLARKGANMANPSIEVDSRGQIVPRNRDSSIESSHTVIVRKSTNDYKEGNLPRKATSLKACKGLKGCQFAACAKQVFGRLPQNFKKLEERCLIDEKLSDISDVEAEYIEDK